MSLPGTTNPQIHRCTSASYSCIHLPYPSIAHPPQRLLPSTAKMPRDLLADKKTLDAMPQLSREPETVSSPESVEQSSLVPHRSSNIAQEGRLKQMGVRPYASLLNIDDLDDCDWLEHAAFDPVEAASREKVRRTICCPSCFSSVTVNACISYSVPPLGSVRPRTVRSSPSPGYSNSQVCMLFVYLVSIQHCTKLSSPSCIHQRHQSSLSYTSWSLFPILVVPVLCPFLLKT